MVQRPTACASPHLESSLVSSSSFEVMARSQSRTGSFLRARDAFMLTQVLDNLRYAFVDNHHDLTLLGVAQVGGSMCSAFHGSISLTASFRLQSWQMLF